ncbi:MAG: EVE domain-containing protein [Bacteroidetes bacterium]|nr:EVE domain-containing protein [Bacteroidota bacterium]MBK7569697.1 EVE domain-containing protein [Bacteroidota bacterium]
MTSNYWLIKSEPDTYGWDKFAKDKKTSWTGIRNYAARIHLRAMKKGDICLYYHSGGESAVVGIATVIKEAYLDPTATEGEWYAVDVKAEKKLKNPVTLKQIKAEKSLSEMPLVRISRLSVSPILEQEFLKILDMSGTEIKIDK